MVLKKCTICGNYNDKKSMLYNESICSEEFLTFFLHVQKLNDEARDANQNEEDTWGGYGEGEL